MKLIHALNFKLAAGLAVIVGAVSAHAAPVFTPNRTILSALRDTTGLLISDTKYSVDLVTDSGDSDLYVNSLALTLGSGWNSNLNINIDTTQTSYTFGSAITGGDSINFQNIVRRGGAVDSSVADGIYDFSLDFIGGANSSDTNLLSSVNLQVEVLEGLLFSISSVASPSIIGQGGVSTVSATLTNNMTSRDLKTTTWYTANLGYSNGSNQLTGNFVGNWFDHTLTPGNSRTDDHTTWTASATQALGVYNGEFGIVGGVHEGDEHFMIASSAPIEVVPEPATMTALALGGLALLRRRRKS
jgi:hypothetical protein